MPTKSKVAPLMFYSTDFQWLSIEKADGRFGAGGQRLVLNKPTTSCCWLVSLLLCVLWFSTLSPLVELTLNLTTPTPTLTTTTTNANAALSTLTTTTTVASSSANQLGGSAWPNPGLVLVWVRCVFGAPFLYDARLACATNDDDDNQLTPFWAQKPKLVRWGPSIRFFLVPANFTPPLSSSHTPTRLTMFHHSLRLVYRFVVARSRLRQRGHS